MEGKRFIRTLRVRNLLSYGPDSEEIALEPLNVLIGPNGSGKSNLISAISVLAAAPRDLTEPFHSGGGIADWLWKGSPDATKGEILATFDGSVAEGGLEYEINLGVRGQRVELLSEEIRDPESARLWNSPLSQRFELDGEEMAIAPDEEPYYRYAEGMEPAVRRRSPAEQAGLHNPMESARQGRRDWANGRSVLSQRLDPELYPEIGYLADQLPMIRFYREPIFGREAQPRRPQSADLPQDLLEEDGRNLALVINALRRRPEERRLIVENLRAMLEFATDVDTRIFGGTVVLDIIENGLNEAVPASRLSDGTLRFLCLTAILCHPEPPPLACIEEPELGLHPDILSVVARMMVEASKRMQLIVTTHSDLLVSHLSDTPEAVVVCDRRASRTVLRRLAPGMAGEAPLGERWLSGEIGGIRW